MERTRASWRSRTATTPRIGFATTRTSRRRGHMRHIRDYARATLAALAQDPLLAALAGDLSPVRSLQILPHVTFWSNAFQDIIALNLERVRDPRVRAIAQNHYDE